MNVLVIGRGGREHSLIQKLAESDRVERLYAAPGNAGMTEQAECITIDEGNQEALVAFAKEKDIRLTIIGPEDPLAAGLADAFTKAGLPVFAPSGRAALIEGSKHFAKQLMKKYDIPTADYQAFTDADKAKAYIAEKGAPIVVKADGLAAGKGVVVAESAKEAEQAVEEMLGAGRFGEAGREVVIEEFLDGDEFSLMAFVRGGNVYPMVPARDHKRAFEGDQGPNTGGMGAYAPVPTLSRESYETALEMIVRPAANAMVEEDRSFTGVLYAGLIETKEGPKVIEFNARFGDPETQVVLPLLENDLVQVLLDVLDGKDPELTWKKQFCAGVVVASKGYPGSYDKGRLLPELKTDKSTFFVHAGTVLDEKGYVSNGGRVLLAGSLGGNTEEALDKAYRSLQVFDTFDDFFYRRDIGRSTLFSAGTEKHRT
ncbi:phosphoribosylamine--glycine ligase [Halobacillus kuroshimensis]|uniref:Phosphoribosylamine--glycine ligase n=1 Tax=Halobacillus kuroshimensis TaxID=302481 RepID=A0ABS3DWP2_9BACI|nr:phosphoribosylamine--glycine ligase [Halobacillus kuroshimensis]MBN8235754.1 phosphoribosylamine--glycine ligase [Halobacillus kuroshimensis]